MGIHMLVIPWNTREDTIDVAEYTVDLFGACELYVRMIIKLSHLVLERCMK